MQIKRRPYAWLYTMLISVFIFAILLTIIVTCTDKPVTENTMQTPPLDQESEMPTIDPIPEVTPPPETTTPPTPTINLIAIPTLFGELTYQETDSIEILEIFLKDADDAIIFLQSECNTTDKYTVKALTMMLKEIDRLNAEQTLARQQIALVRQQIALETKWAEKALEYPYATRLWQYLKTLGYSDIACAGILGNVMAECGGLTLDLQPFIYDPAGEYYGMFQWSLRYYPEAEGMSFDEQLEYYRQTSGPTFKTWGKNYADGFTFDDFNELTDPRETALAFAKIYERCASWTYEIRQNLAEVAYQYFIADFEELPVQ